MYTLSNFEAAYENKLTVYVNAAKNAMNLDHIDLARMYLDSAEMQLHEVPHSTYAPYYYRTKGVYFRNVKDKDRALASFRQGITLAEDLLDDFAQRDLSFEMYATYRDRGEYANAKKYLSIASIHAPPTVIHNRLLNAHEKPNTEHHLDNYT